MSKPNNYKYKWSVVGLAIVFTFVNFFLLSERVQAQLVPTAESGLLLQQILLDAGTHKAERIADTVQEELKAVFFKNVLGNLANLVAQQTAIWVSTGGKGGVTRWYDNLSTMLKDYPNAAAADFLETVIKDLTGIDICTVDPRVAINLSLQIPFFPDYNPELNKPDCTFSQLRSHWEEIGKTLAQRFSFNFDVTEGGSFGENVDKMSQFVTADKSLMWFDERLNEYASNGCAPSGSMPGVPRGKCEISFMPAIGNKLQFIAETLKKQTTVDLKGDVDNLINYAGSENPVCLSNDIGCFRVAPEYIPQIQEAWNKLITTQTAEIDKIITAYSACQNKDALTLSKPPCDVILNDIDIKAPPPTSLTGNESIGPIFAVEVNNKIAYVINIANYLKSGYSYLSSQVNQLLTPDLFEGSIPYNARLMQDLFTPKANELNAYNVLATEIMNKGFESFINTHFQAMVDQGWKSVTDRIADTIRTPSNVLRAEAEEELIANGKTSKYYTKSIKADALGVFLETLYNQLMRQLLDALNSKDAAKETRSVISAKAIATPEIPVIPPFDPFNPFEQAITTPSGTQSYLERLTQRFTANYSFQNLDLLTDFQTNLQGEVNPNIYNNVIDPNLALAINDRKTIAQAMADGQLVSDFTFSWGEKADSGTYNLSNIKKLRKARVVPLGLELAVELIQDCTYRQEIGFGDFHDLNSTYKSGQPDAGNDYKTQKLQNCLFKPVAGAGTEDADRKYNTRKLNEVIGATLADVVNGFDKVGENGCGGGGENESPFCNLVDPNWVLKLPLTRCQLETDSEPYGEILQTNSTGQRYSRCPDFVSCLQEDGKGGCIQEKYGICVKEKNIWELGASTCPAEFNSCTSFSTSSAGSNVAVSYLKNTLSGNDICGPNNAGCAWYATKSSVGNLWQDFASFFSADACQNAGGTWLDNHCQSERIYFDNYVQSCNQSGEGCTKFYLFRDPANNLVTDSSFEYTNEGAFPQNWNLILKREVGSDKEIVSRSACLAVNNDAHGCQNEGDCGYAETCSGFQYADQSSCTVNNGQWVGACTNLPAGQTLVDSTSPEECTSKNGTWAYTCQNATNSNVSVADCGSNGGTYKSFCYTSVLQYNLCANPQFQTQELCTTNGGNWVSQCEVNGEVVATLGTEAICTQEPNNGNWHQFCQGAQLYNSSQAQCLNLSGTWRGQGPFGGNYGVCSGGNVSLTDKASCEALGLTWLTGLRAEVIKNGQDVQYGLAGLKINLESLDPTDQYLLMYKSKLPGNLPGLLTKGGDVYTATAYLKSNTTLSANFSLSKNYLTNFLNYANEVNSRQFDVFDTFSQVDITLVTAQNGTKLDILFNLPGNQSTGSTLYIDGVNLYLNTQDQVSNLDFVKDYTDYTANSSVYYKKPPARLECHGYGPGDPPPVIDIARTSENPAADCGQQGGYWDAPASGVGVYIPDRTGVCYKYKPDAAVCSNFAKVCQPEEVGCQMYRPVNGDPEIPGAVNATDYCPAECIGYAAYKQDTTPYEPNPETPYQYFIPETANACTLDEVGCSQFTNLDEVAKGGEGIQYFTYLRQCIKPAEFISKTYFTWQGSAGGPPQPVKYEFQADTDGSPKMTDGSGDCTLTLGAEDFNCVKFFDSAGTTYYRDITLAITVSDDCHPYRKTESTQENCQATNGIWQADTSSCLYNAIPSENLACRAEANGCRAFVGNRGNNIYAQLFDNFESGTSMDWNQGLTGSNGGLAPVGESVVVGGHSLFVPGTINTAHKALVLQKGDLYTLSFWAKTDNVSGVSIGVKFVDGVGGTLANFATSDSNKVKLTSKWQNYILGPIFVSWDNTGDNNLVFDQLVGGVYLDNILLKAVRDNVYVVKDSWETPASCDHNYYGGEEKGAMLGCQAYQDSNGNLNYLKSFASLCRASTVGCQLVFDTQNSLNPNSQTFNDTNVSYLDDYTLPKDQLTTLVLNSASSCSADDKGCQRMGKPVYEGMNISTYNDVYLKNDPDKYINVPQAIMCNDDSLGCSALTNDAGVTEYFKIEPDKLCQFGQNTVNGQNVEGWFKNGSATLGCGSLATNEAPSATVCHAAGGEYSDKYKQCTLVLQDIKDLPSCNDKKGEWIQNKCLANPFTIYKVYEANKYKGYSGLCDAKWNGCTEFKDINPNFIFNGSFESIDTNGRVANWNWNSASAGNQKFESDNVQDGKQAVKLIKTTNQTCPATYLYSNTSPCVLDENVVPSFSITSDTIALLAKGKTYKISFYYRMPNDARGVGDNCPLPEAAFSLDKIVNNGTGGGTSIVKGDINIYGSESSWKKVETLFTIPAGEDLQNYQLSFYAPLNKNQAASAAAGSNMGNCPGSYVEYDQVEVKDNTEDSYYNIDLGNNLDRSSCTAVDWDGGCVQFYNTANSSYELLKVNRDRNCQAWAVCKNKDANGFCTELDLCNTDQAGACVAFDPKSDNVRYDINKNPLVVKRVNNFDNKTGYIYRYGAGAFTRIVSWRAGDYSGYTLADRYPLETELINNAAFKNNFQTYTRAIDLGTKPDLRSTKPICKVFAGEDSPLPDQLAVLPQYKNLLSVYSSSEALDDLGNLCAYEKVTAGTVQTYLHANAAELNNLICTGPEGFVGNTCTTDAQCNGQPLSCQQVTQAKDFFGLEGMCLEYDYLNPLYDGIYKDTYDESFQGVCSVAIPEGQPNTQASCEDPAVGGTWTVTPVKDYSYQPYACLTYFPFTINLCPFHNATDCLSNPDCKLAGGNTTCVAK